MEELIRETLHIARIGLRMALRDGDVESARVHARGIVHCYHLMCGRIG